MAQFHVYRLPNGGFVLDLQSDDIALATRVVARLVPVSHSPPPLPPLKPAFRIRGADYVLHTPEMAAIAATLCDSAPVADLGAEADTIRAALDMIFTGF